MPQPPAYNRTKDFTADFGSETDHASLNAELDAASNSINDIRTNLALIQADDGKILQAAITTDSLSTTVKDYLIDQVSGGIVQYRDDAANSASAAASSASQAATSATNASNSATSANTQATNAATSATLAQNWATKTDAEVVVGQGYGAKKYANDAANSAASVQSYIDHVSDTANPHAVTKAQVGLGNVDNTSDADKPVSTAQQTALDAKVGKTGDETIAGVKTFNDGILVKTGGVERIKINADGGVKLNKPYLAATSASAQTVSIDATTLCEFASVQQDTHGYYNPTNATVNGTPAYAFKPLVAGWYGVDLAVSGSGTTTTGRLMAIIYKNGAAFRTGSTAPQGNANTGWADIGATVFLNGSTDYLQFYGNVGGSGTMSLNGAGGHGVTVILSEAA